MDKFKNLKVVVAGQFGKGAEFKYGYPVVPLTDEPRNNWIKMDMVEKDPLDVRNYFPQATGPIYKMRVSTYGSYYALVAPCKYDTSGRNGYYSITLFIAKGTKYTGAQVRSTLNALNVVLYDANNFSASASTLVEQCFEQNGWIPESQEPMIMPVKSVPAYKDAYREYSSESELDTIMQYAMQPEYTGCRWIYLVKSGLLPESQLSKLTTRIRVKYEVDCPHEDVKVNKANTADGELLNIVYSKASFDDFSVSVKVGSPESSQYLEYSETKITVKSAAEAGVAFEKSIRVMLFDTEGKAVRAVPRITVNGVPSPGSVVKVKDSDLGSKLHIKISAGLYEDAEDDIDASRLVKAPQLKVTLKPRIGSVKLNITIGNKEFSCVEALAPSDPLYQSLQRGTFNGYKASRRQNSDEYDVDVTSGRSASVGGSPRIIKTKDNDGSKNSLLTRIITVLVTFAIGIAGGVILERSISSTEEPEPAVVAEVETPTEIKEENKHEESALIDQPAKETEEAQPEVEAEKTEEAESQPEEQPAEKAEEVKEEAPKTEETKSKATPYESLSEDEKADIKYLKSSDTWSSSKIKSQRFKNMFAQLNSGNIDCLNSNFGGYEKDYVNGYALSLISSIKKLSPEEREKAKRFLRESENGNIKMSWAASQIGKMAKR